jgi:CubicO group peptidase (beta-lactamase class C family)
MLFGSPVLRSAFVFFLIMAGWPLGAWAAPSPVSAPWAGSWRGVMGSGTHHFQVAFEFSEETGFYDNLDDGIYDEPLTFDTQDGELLAKTRGGGRLKLDYFPGCPSMTGTFTQGEGADGQESLVGNGSSYPITLTRGDERLHPRPVTTYAYVPPPLKTDGLEVGDLREQPIQLQGFQNLIQNVLTGNEKHLHSLLVLKDDRLVLEEYFYGYGPDEAHPVQSATKRIFSLLLGPALEKGWLRPNQKLYDLFPDRRASTPWDARKDNITLKHLLTMTSGASCDDWDEDKGCSWDMVASGDWARFSFGLPLARKPGTRFAYCGACLSPLVELLERRSGMNVTAYADQVLFKPLGIESPAWWEGPNGFHSPAFGLSLKPRDMAKIGQLVLHRGKWKDLQVVPESWIAESTSKQVVGTPGKRPDYGYLWWERNVIAQGRVRRVLEAWGVGGQYIFIVPDGGVVVVMTGGDTKDGRTSGRCWRLFKRTFDILEGSAKTTTRPGK